MAESVDALVSNTSGAIHPGSIPGLGTISPLQISEFTRGFFSYVLKTERFPAYQMSITLKMSIIV